MEYTTSGRKRDKLSIFIIDIEDPYHKHGREGEIWIVEEMAYGGIATRI